MPLFFLFLLFLSATAPAVTVSLSLDELGGYLRDHHPLLAAARLRIEEAEGRHRGSGRLANPEVGLGVASDRHFREGAVELSLEQRFPLTARLRLERAVTREAIAVARWEVREMERRMVATGRELGVRWLALDGQVAIRERQTALLEAWAATAREQAAKGELSPVDAGQIALEASRLALDLQALRGEQLALHNELAASLGLAPGTRLVLTGALSPPQPPPGGESWEARPDYRQALARQKQARTEVALAESRRWDDLTAALAWEAEREAEESGSLETHRFLGVRLSLPLPLWDRNEGEIAEKRAGARRAALETEARREAIAHEIAAAKAAMSASAALATESRHRLLPQARQQVGRVEAAYAQGEATLADLLRTREQQLGLEAAALDHLRDFHLARVRYEAALAQPKPSTKRSRP